jgi:GNAT superfamily N-acetyltransferase
MALTVRPAEIDDAPALRDMILELAHYERLAPLVTASIEDIRAALFGPVPRAFCEVAQLDGATAGFAVWFYSFSTFEGRHGIFIEDLFVRAPWRRTGVGTRLMATLAKRCNAEKLTRMEWRMLSWNDSAGAFFARLGTRMTADWQFGRMGPDSLADLGGESRP